VLHKVKEEENFNIK